MSTIEFISVGQPSAQSIIFLHGMGLGADSWQPQIKAFASHYHVLALNLNSDAIKPENSMSAYAEALAKFMDEHELVDPILVGHSFGGMIVQEFLAQYPNVAKAVVVYGSSPAFGDPNGEWQQAFIKARLAPLDAGRTMVDLAEEMVDAMTGSARYEANKLDLAHEDIKATTEQHFRDFVHCLGTFDQRKNLVNIDIPSLFIVGSEDANAPAPMMEKMAFKVEGAEYVCLDKLGHLAHLENPEVFNASLKGFLEAHKL